MTKVSKRDTGDTKPDPDVGARELRNWEVVVYALYLKEGATRSVHTEDVALQCFELAPRSFSWIKHPQYPDKDIVRVALTDARKAKTAGRGALVEGRSGRSLGKNLQTGRAREADGWRLTEEGAAWVVANKVRFEKVLSTGADASKRQDLIRKLARVRGHELYEAFEASPKEFNPQIGALADLLRCRVDAETVVWRKRFEALRASAQLAEQDDVLEFLRRCEEFVASEFEESGS